SDGYLWLGTPSALLRFDGQRFSPMGGGPSLPEYAFIRDLVEASAGELYGATAGGVLEVVGDRLRLLRTKGGPARPIVESLAEGPGGTLWVGTARSGVWRLRADELTLVLGGEPGAPLARVNDLEVSPDGRLWAATDSGVVALGPSIERFGRSAGLPSPSTNTLE